MNLSPHALADVVYALALTHDGIGFAARQSGLYRSDDAGASWHNAYSSIQSDTPLMTTTVALSPDFSSDATLFAGIPGGILRSRDGGETWALIPLGAGVQVTSFALSSNFPVDGSLWASTSDDGLYFIGEQGAICRRWNYGLFDWHVFCLAATLDGTLYAGTESGISMSRNAGGSWSAIDFPTLAAPVLSLVVTPDGLVFAGTEAHGLFRSTDGEIWGALDFPLDAPINQLSRLPDASLMAICPNGIWISADNGDTWQPRYPNESETPITCASAPGSLGDGRLLLGFGDGAIRAV